MCASLGLDIPFIKRKDYTMQLIIFKRCNIKAEEAMVINQAEISSKE